MKNHQDSITRRRSEQQYRQGSSDRSETAIEESESAQQAIGGPHEQQQQQQQYHVGDGDDHGITIQYPSLSWPLIPMQFQRTRTASFVYDILEEVERILDDAELDFVQTPSTSDSGGSGSDQNNVGATN